MVKVKPLLIYIYIYPLTSVFTTTNNISYIKNAWVVQLHEELANMSDKLLSTDIKSGVLQRKNDEFLMDMFIRQYTNTSTLRQLNYCRMYLQIEWLSDITTNDGKQLHLRYYYGLQQKPYTNHRWPYQEKPLVKIWDIWKEALDRVIGGKLTLCYPLQE